MRFVWVIYHFLKVDDSRNAFSETFCVSKWCIMLANAVIFIIESEKELFLVVSVC